MSSRETQTSLSPATLSSSSWGIRGVLDVMENLQMTPRCC